VVLFATVNSLSEAARKASLFATVKRSSEARPWNLGAAAEKSERFFSLFATVKRSSKTMYCNNIYQIQHYLIYIFHIVRMSSINRFLKQIPLDSQYFIPVNSASDLALNLFHSDPTSVNTYVSGAAAGFFTTSNISAATFAMDGSGTLTVFRDMGKTILSSGRTFRRVQLLSLDGNKATGGGGTTGWTTTTSPGTWKSGNEGVSGNPSASILIDSDFCNFYFETGARGLGIAQGLIRYG
jgi:hypothetical protein